MRYGALIRVESQLCKRLQVVVSSQYNLGSSSEFPQAAYSLPGSPGSFDCARRALRALLASLRMTVVRLCNRSGKALHASKPDLGLPGARCCATQNQGRRTGVSAPHGPTLFAESAQKGGATSMYKCQSRTISGYGIRLFWSSGRAGRPRLR
jgi:hypothetical protein